MKRVIQNRRQFFKEAAKSAIPVLFSLTIIPTFVSCNKDKSIEDSFSCDGTCNAECSSTCTTSCTGACSKDCSAECGNSCKNGCLGTCKSGCSGSSTNSGCSSCSNSCSSICANSCESICSNSANNSPNNTISEASGSIDGHDYVDLGLSVKWARCNINASQPQIKGLYGLINVHYLNEARRILLMQSVGYTTASTSQVIMELGGIPDFDMVTQQWGNNWRTPSKSEWQELKDNCDFEAFEIESISGVRVISRINGNSIFLPLPGCIYNGTWVNVGCWAQLPSSTFVFQYWVCNEDIVRIQKGTNNIDFNFYGTIGSKYHFRAVTTEAGGSTTCNGSCVNTAINNCSSCQIGCTTNCQMDCTTYCTSQCSDSCEVGCKTTCDGNCPNGCYTLCGGACKYSCGGSCSYVSAGGNCASGTCANMCVNYCYHTCTLACSESCLSCCIYSAK